MAEAVEVWDGDSWEAHCLLLLRVRYRPPSPFRFQYVPSEDRGDGGIEGFSTDGIIYQCYAPDAFLPIAGRREKQRDKLTKDVGTLIANADLIQALIGELRISKYVYLVPRHDSKEVNRYAKRQEDRVVAANLSFVTDDFVLLVSTEDDYPIESATLLEEGLGRINLETIPATELAIEAFLAGDHGRIEMMRSKLNKEPDIDDARCNQMVRKFIGSYLRGQNATDSLYDQHPAGYERLDELREAEESALSFECEIATDAPLDLIGRIRSEYADSIGDELSFLRDADASSIAVSTVVEWLMDCPLDFHNV